jgi:hypothetical protein
VACRFRFCPSKVIPAPAFVKAISSHAFQAAADAARRLSNNGFFSNLRRLAYNLWMANLTLVYGVRLLPSEEVEQVGDATLKLKNGREAHVTMHVLEGTKDDIEKQLKTSLEAFFDFYPEI